MKNGKLFYLKNMSQPAVPAFPLREGKLVVGRDPSCDVVLFSASVSRRHAELIVTMNGMTVRDLSSRNGTYADGQPVQSAGMAVERSVRFGSVEFEVKTDDTLESGEVEIDTASVSEVVGSLADQIATLPLSTAETRVLELLLMGRAEKEVATALEISHHTVHCHVRKIYESLGVHSRGELLALFIKPEKRDR